MKRPKLKIGDSVAILEQDEDGGERKRYKMKFAKVKTKVGKKIKVEGDTDDYNEEGDNPTAPKKRLLKLTQKITKRLMKSSFFSTRVKLKSLTLDDALLAAFDLDNETDPD
jgi:hypothetical protein